jgi:hypothetical protein
MEDEEAWMARRRKKKRRARRAGSRESDGMGDIMIAPRHAKRSSETLLMSKSNIKIVYDVPKFFPFVFLCILSNALYLAFIIFFRLRFTTSVYRSKLSCSFFRCKLPVTLCHLSLSMYPF